MGGKSSPAGDGSHAEKDLTGKSGVTGGEGDDAEVEVLSDGEECGEQGGGEDADFDTGRYPNGVAIAPAAAAGDARVPE